MFFLFIYSNYVSVFGIDNIWNFSLLNFMGGKFMSAGKLILVDEQNEIIGYGKKLPVHIKGDLHRAFSIFIYNAETEKFLIQKRQFNKYHSGGLWSNSCCSHPYDGENFEDSIKRCIKNELNFDLDITPSDKKNVWNTDLGKIYYTGVFKYFSDYGDIKEHEIDNVYLYVIKQNIDFQFNKDEICELKWLSINEINQLLTRKNYFTSWFTSSYKIVLDFIKDMN